MTRLQHIVVATLFFLLAAAAAADHGWQTGDQVRIEWQGQWYDGRILEVRGNHVLVHYDSWGSEYDEWVDASRLRRASGSWRAGDRVEVLWKDRWYEAEVLEVGRGGGFKVHYAGFDSQWDEWVEPSRIREPALRPPAERPQQPYSSAEVRGVTLYSDADFRGRSETFSSEDPELSDNRIGNDQASSVSVSSGCRAILYERSHYRGRSAVVSDSLVSLHGTAVGNDTVTSLRVECRRRPDGPGGPGGSDGSRGATLFEYENFRGHREFFAYDDPRLNDNSLGQDNASSVRVSVGCRVVLYRDVNFGGASTILTQDAASLRGTRVGNDSVSSLGIDCRGR